MKKRNLKINHDGKSYVEVQPQEATHIAVTVQDMAELESELEDQRRHIASLQQILREKNNRELKIRPAKSKSGYTLWSVATDPRYRPTPESDPIQTYRVKIKTPWLLEEVDMDTALRLWKDDAVRVCAEWGLKYYLDGWKEAWRHWKQEACAMDGLLEAYFQGKCYTVTFFTSKPPKWIEASENESEAE